MGGVCILTDTTAQYPIRHFPGHERVSTVPLHIQLNNRYFAMGKGMRVQDLPVTARNGLKPALKPATVAEFQRIFLHLGDHYDEIVVILTSGHLTSAVYHARQAARSVGGRVNILILDSQTTGVGLGFLVKLAAEAAAGGSAGVDIKRQILGLIPRVYAMFYFVGLTYLSHAGIVGPAQALIAEMLGVMPLFILEGGQLIPVQKARNARHLVDNLYEFVCEFGDLQHIALMQGEPPFDPEVTALRERILEDYPAVPLSEHAISNPLATIFGPRSLGVFVMEKD